MTSRKLDVYHGFVSEDDRMVKLELNRDTRNKLLSKYKFEIINSTWQGDEDKYDIIIEELYSVVKNNSSCGGKHLMLLADGVNLLAFGGNVEGNTLHIFGGGE